MNPRGNVKHGGHGTLTYARWKAMMQRCRASRHYVAAGIMVCERWHDFPSFLTDMGECPHAGLTLERQDNAKGYEPGNCRWATRAEQSANRSSCIELTHNGVTQNIAAWARATGLPENTLWMRVRHGWPVERVLSAALNPAANRHPALDNLSHAGQTRSLLEWATTIGISPNTLRMRLRLGWSVDKALTTPKRARTQPQA